MKLNEVARGWRNLPEPKLTPPDDVETRDVVDVYNDLPENEQWDITYKVLTDFYTALADLFTVEEFEDMYGSYEAFTRLYGEEDDNDHPFIDKSFVPRFVDLVKQEGVSIEEALNEVEFVRLGDFFDMDTNTLRDKITDDKYTDHLFNVLYSKYPERF